MKNKYVMIEGLAFSENKDMEKLTNYAKDGWLLEGIVGGFFYKLRKGEPRDIIYNLDYQADANPEYFSFMKEAGWEHVLSVGNQIHIYSAKAGTKPIYSDVETEQDKYINARKQTKKGSIYTLIAGVILFMLAMFSKRISEPLFFITQGLLIVDVVLFIFNFMPYIAYNYRVNKTNNGDKQNENNINKGLYRFFLFMGTITIVFGVIPIVKSRSITISTMFLLIYGSMVIILALISKRKHNKHNN